jgi:hypothetical protein
VTKSLEASPPQKTGGRWFERAVLRNTKQVSGSFATRWGISLAHELFYVVHQYYYIDR